ncbi:uncharacterized protein LOC117499961 [Trematomus bernacchii]|uniref:uncharacterized protein LOC117499961 n=1 Tax=Trematomus bernacchii TaxID=40690 RepID=UPI00146C0C43|nr:uncharacterized protein LOC117499961 [Trematomus bernacchii]
MWFSLTHSLPDMTVQLSFLLIFTGLTGIHSITTVSKVSVRAGGSITIPCLYESKHTNNVKYLCKVSTWDFCSDKVKTNKPSSSGKFSISDDKTQRVFTVTINDLTGEDTDYYWCAVEIDYGPDLGTRFHLSVTGGNPYLYVDEQKRTGFRGEEITIDYHYYNAGDIKWCRLGSSCVTRPNGWLENSRVTMNNVPGLLSVTLSGLRTESSGWYLCVKGDLQMPVHITVTEKPTTTTSPATSEPVKQTSSSADQPLSTVEGKQQSVSGNLKSFIIPLSLLIFIVMVAMFIWFMFKKHRQTKEESPATIISNEEVTYSTVKNKRKTGQLGLAEEEVTYSDVKHMRRASEKWSEANRDVDVMYSSVVAVERQTKQRSNAEVTYSTVKKKRKTGQLGLAEEEVTYSDVKHMRRASEKWSEANGDVDVMYSSVVAVERQTKQRSNVEVTYSTVKKKRKTGQLGLAEEEVTYSDVKHMRRASEKWSEANRDVDVMYSSVVAAERQTKQRSNAEVTYSTVKKKRKTGQLGLAEEEVTYSDVKHMRRVSEKWSEANRDVDVMYSSVVAAERQTKQRSNAEVTYSTVKKKRKTGRLGLAEEEVTYSDVKHMRRASEKWSEANRDVDVMYSSVVAVERQTKQRSNAEVTYSTVKKKRKTGQLGLAEEEVTYSDVKHMRRASEKWSEANRDVDVMYSSVVAVERQTKQMIQAEEDDVT